MVISEWIWLKFGMDVPNVPRLEKKWVATIPNIGSGWLVGRSIWLNRLKLPYLNRFGWMLARVTQIALIISVVDIIYLAFRKISAIKSCGLSLAYFTSFFSWFKVHHLFVNTRVMTVLMVLSIDNSEVLYLQTRWDRTTAAQSRW